MGMAFSANLCMAAPITTSSSFVGVHSPSENERDASCTKLPLDTARNLKGGFISFDPVLKQNLENLCDVVDRFYDILVFMLSGNATYIPIFPY